jgi:hypothetical protein
VLVGTRDPRKQMCMARTMAMLIRALTYPRTTAYSFSHLSARAVDSFFSKHFASLPKRPSVETTNGVKCRRCAIQDARYFLLFYFSWDSNTFAGSLERLLLASVLVTRTSMMQSVPRTQRPRMSKSPRSSPLFLCKLRVTAG